MLPARRLTLFSAAILAALAAVLAVLLPAGTPSAAGGPAAGNRVWAFSLAAQARVGADRLVSPGQRLGEPAPCPFCVSGACVAPEAADPGLGAVRTVLRADTRGPEEIFSRGFEPKGGNMDLWQHVNENPADSGFVSTTKSMGSAQDFAKMIGSDYIYQARASGYDVNAIFGAKSPFPWENEISVPGPVPPSSIEGVWGPRGWVPNPGFAP